MNYLTRIALVAVLALAAAGLAQPAHSDERQVGVVLAGRAAEDPALVAAVRDQLRGTGVQMRVPRTATEQLGVTHLFAAAGYDAIVAVDLDRRHAVAPVQHRYPGVRFIDAPSDASEVVVATSRAAR